VTVLAELLPNINELFEWKGIFGGHTVLEFNKTALMAFVSTAICIGFFAFGSRKKALVPSGIQNVAEMGYDMIEENVSLAAIGEDGRKWTPYFTCLFFWIFFINIWSVIPGNPVPATSRIAIPLFLALLSWGIFIVVGVIKQGPGYFWHAINPTGRAPGAEVPRRADRVLLEVPHAAVLAGGPTLRQHDGGSPAAHDLRDHDQRAPDRAQQRHLPGGLRSAAVPRAHRLHGFELLVAVLQAYIFTILTAVYVAESLHPEH
jgi:F-type H+-transporting ATPase subunit a